MDIQLQISTINKKEQLPPRLRHP